MPKDIYSEFDGKLSKTGYHFSNKSDLKMILSKYVNNKKRAPKLVFFNEKKLRKIRMIFDIENLYPPFENSTTRIAILDGQLLWLICRFLCKSGCCFFKRGISYKIF